ncbi:MAG TPA: endonuclease MutS2 [Clostridiaceae bacterium]|nr:endonuclease MutS2 [Clostridiaceae bacterium]
MNEKTLRVLEFDKIVSKVEDLAASSLGKELARELKPICEPDKVSMLLKETSDAQSLILRKGNPPMGGVHDIRASLRRVSLEAVLNPGELLKIAEVLGACRNLKNYARDERGAEKTIENIAEELIMSLVSNRNMEDKIKSAILSEDEISDNASVALKNIRRNIRALHESIKEKLNSILRSSKYQKFMQESVVTLRGDRYVVPVKQEYRNEIPGLVHDMSSSGATIFIEPMAVVEANNEIKQLRIKEAEEIERILMELTGDVAGILTELNSNVSLLARLDFMFAKAKLSLAYNCVCPRLNNSKRIKIVKGRHPLLDQHTVVPIDLWIGDSFKTLVITGPNTGGKTVTLKTVGLFALMTQAGLHIPAGEGTEMSIFDRVYADIGDEQSIEQSLSTFSSHMTNIVNIMENADSNSLVLFDELGAGTDPTEGAALAMAILDRLRELGAITIATTHYSELKIYALSTESVENACCEFDVETLKPTYKLLVGVPGKSNAFAISKRLGLSEKIIAHAKELLKKEDIRFEDILMSIEKNRQDAERDRMQAEAYRRQVEELKEEMEAQRIKLESQKENILREARMEARSILRGAKEEVEYILTEMRRFQEMQRTAVSNREVEELRVRLKSNIDEIESSLVQSIMPRDSLVAPPENLKPGDTVLIVNLNQRGTVVTPPDKNGEALIQAGIIKINVHVSNLRPVDEQKQVIDRIGSGKIGVSKSRTISKEIDLRGMTLDDAIIAVSKYLDDVSLAGLKEVTLIHGKGTGALRNGLQQYLRTNPHVASFRTGKFGEGESGVTIVEMK